MNRRAQAELYYSFFRTLLIVFLVFFLTVQLGFFDVGMDTDMQEAGVIKERVLARLAGEVPGTISAARFNTKEVSESYLELFGDDNLWGARLRLYESTAAFHKGEVEKEVFVDEDGLANRILPMARAGARGEGGGDYYAWLFPVMVAYDAETQKPRWLTIEVVKRT